jgi:hypothetical protein
MGAIIDAIAPVKAMAAIALVSACCAWSIFSGALMDSFVVRSAVRSIQFLDPVTAYNQAQRCGTLAECASIAGVESCSWVPLCFVRCCELTFVDMMIATVQDHYPSLVSC